MPHPLDIACTIAAGAFADHRDAAGRPLILHALAVGFPCPMPANWTDLHRITGLLHDLLEDTPWTEAALSTCGLPRDAVMAICLLTRTPPLHYREYIRTIAAWARSGERLAAEVKLVDLAVNLGRLPTHPNPGDLASRWTWATGELEHALSIRRDG